MGWPLAFHDLTQEEKHLRRLALDRYATYAQLSGFLPVVIFLLYRMVTWAVGKSKARKGTYDAVPSSPSRKTRRLSHSGSFSVAVRVWKWWLGDDVVIFGRVWGTRDQWIFGTLWTAWLLLTCVLETGGDYIHVTKRFGSVAGSQFPLHYLLSLKGLNPFAFVFKSSHEEINRWHRVLGRIIYMLLAIHAVLYINYFVQFNKVHRLFVAPVPLLGVISFIMMNLVNTTAMRTIRRYSYRIFFITHMTVATVLPWVLIFHTKHMTVFTAEASLVLLVDIVYRKLDTVVGHTTLESIPGTSLIKMTASSIPLRKLNKIRAAPGSHVYLQVPASARPSSNPVSPSSLVFEMLYNPFTVADVNEKSGDLTLIARHLSGPMTANFRRLAGSHGAHSLARHEAKIPFNIEGPYGSAKHFPSFISGEFDRILLVAGGVGATFIVPLYRAIVQDCPPGVKVEMVWSIRGAGDATWATGKDSSNSIMEDENVNIFLTGDLLDDASGMSDSAKSSSTARHRHSPNVGADGDAVEMSNLNQDWRQNKLASLQNRKRPNMQKIVDDVFRHGAEERVAVLVCGPDEMARDLRNCVGAWIRRGRSVWWHNESFGL